MNLPLWKKVLVVVAILAPTPLLAPCLSGQEAQPNSPAKPSAAAKPKAKTPGSPLPSYYSGVVTETQKQEIYKIQQTYKDKIAALAEQIKDLQAKQKAEVEALLTPEQKATIEKIAAESKAKAKAKADAKAKEAEGDKTDAKPAVKP